MDMECFYAVGAHGPRDIFRLQQFSPFMHTSRFEHLRLARAANPVQRILKFSRSPRVSSTIVFVLGAGFRSPVAWVCCCSLVGCIVVPQQALKGARHRIMCGHEHALGKVARMQGDMSFGDLPTAGSHWNHRVAQFVVFTFF